MKTESKVFLREATGLVRSFTWYDALVLSLAVTGPCIFWMSSAYRQAAHLTENIGPRPSGSPQAKAAVDYVTAEVRQLGLDVQLEEVKVPASYSTDRFATATSVVM